MIQAKDKDVFDFRKGIVLVPLDGDNQVRIDAIDLRGG